jgi:hypothetical protein
LEEDPQEHCTDSLAVNMFETTIMQALKEMTSVYVLCLKPLRAFQAQLALYDGVLLGTHFPKAMLRS